MRAPVNSKPGGCSAVGSRVAARLQPHSESSDGNMCPTRALDVSGDDRTCRQVCCTGRTISLRFQIACIGCEERPCRQRPLAAADLDVQRSHHVAGAWRHRRQWGPHSGRRGCCNPIRTWLCASLPQSMPSEKYLGRTALAILAHPPYARRRLRTTFKTWVGVGRLGREVRFPCRLPIPPCPRDSCDRTRSESWTLPCQPRQRLRRPV